MVPPAGGHVPVQNRLTNRRVRQALPGAPRRDSIVRHFVMAREWTTSATNMVFALERPSRKIAPAHFNGAKTMPNHAPQAREAPHGVFEATIWLSTFVRQTPIPVSGARTRHIPDTDESSSGPRDPRARESST